MWARGRERVVGATAARDSCAAVCACCLGSSSVAAAGGGGFDAVDLGVAGVGVSVAIARSGWTARERPFCRITVGCDCGGPGENVAIAGRSVGGLGTCGRG